MKKTFTLIFVLAFLAVCLVPGIAYILGYTPANYENRPLAREASLVVRGQLNLGFPSDFDSWWEDHFGLREEGVTAFHALTMGLFGDTLNEKVVVGGDGWLYYAETLEDYLNLEPMSVLDIERAAAVIRLIAEYCEQNGMRFAFMNAPNKSTVYPEHMPAYLAPADGEGNRVRLYAALEAHGVDTVDLASLLTAHKADGQLYYKQDTHWNARGARIAYNAIMRDIAEGFAYDTYLDNEESATSSYRGDLHNFVLPSAGGRGEYIDYGIEKRYTMDSSSNPARDVSFGTTLDGEGIKVLVYRDSFGEALIPMISNNASRAVYSQEFPYNLVFTAEEFDAVVIELVERNIKNLLTGAPLMPALDAALPENAAAVSGAQTDTRTRSGYTQLFGCYEGDSAAYERVFVKLVLNDGVTRVFEAFPVMEEDALSLADGMACPRGFSLTLPQGIAEGDWGEISIFTAIS